MQTSPLRFVLPALLELTLGAPAQVADVEIVSGNATLGLDFHNGHGLVFAFAQLGSDVFVAAAEEPLVQFQLWSRTADGTPGTCECPTYAEDIDDVPIPASGTVSHSTVGSEHVFVWPAVAGESGVTYAVELRVAPAASGEFSFTTTVDVASGTPTRGVGRIDCPRVHVADPGEASLLLLGLGNGLQLLDPAEHASQLDADTGQPEAIEVLHPGHATLPLVALTNVESGHRTSMLVLTTPEAAPERFALKEFRARGTAPLGVRLEVGRWLDDPFTPLAEPHAALGSLALVPITHDDSAWFDLGRWHRDRIDAELTRDPIAELTGLHAEAMDYDVVLAIGPNTNDATYLPDYTEFTAHADAFTSYVGIDPDRADMVWFDWHANKMGQSLPTQLPAKDESAYLAALRAAQLAGYAVSPYTSSCIFGAGNASFPAHPDYPMCAPTVPDCPDAIANWVAVAPTGLPQTDQGVDLEGATGHADRQPFCRAIAGLNAYWIDELMTPLVEQDGSPGTHGVDGIYNDFFLTSMRCFADDHGHPVGGGHSYPVGAVGYLNRMRNLLLAEGTPPRITTEAPIEATASVSTGTGFPAWRDSWTIPRDALGYAPIFLAAYHDQVPVVTSHFRDAWNHFSFANWHVYFWDANATVQLAIADAFEDHVHMATAAAWAHGYRLVWTHRDAVAGAESVSDNPIPDSVFELLDTSWVTTPVDGHLLRVLDFQADTLRVGVKAHNREFLSEARLAVPPIVDVDELAVTPPPPTPVTFTSDELEKWNSMFGPLGPFETQAVPAVFSAAFQTADGDVAITFANWTDTTRQVTYSFDPVWYGLDPNASYLVLMSGPLTDDVLANPASISAYDSGTIDVPSRLPMVLHIKKL